MTVSARTLDTIAQIVEGSEPIRLANQLGQQRDDWRTRAERAEALLRELVIERSTIYIMHGSAYCWYCYERQTVLHTHHPTCPIARARALLETPGGHPHV